MSDHENLLLKLRQEASGYSPTQQNSASLSSAIPPECLYLTITELARESHTSEASVTRLCRTLGCKAITNSKWRWRWIFSRVEPAREAGG